MASYYSIVQYLPDPIIDERINVGVIVFGDGHIRARFVRNWRRISVFGGKANIDFLRDFAERVEEGADTLQAPLPGMPGLNVFTQTTLEKITGTWTNSIQITQPRASLKRADDLLDDISVRFLRETQVKKSQGRDRRAAARIAVATMERALVRSADQTAGEYLRKHFIVQGKSAEYPFDAVLANGHVYSAVQGLSFETGDTRDQIKDAEATAWAVDDVKKGDDTISVGIVIIPPRGESKAYDHARKIFSGVDAPLLAEGSAFDWAVRIVAGLPALEGHGTREPEPRLLS